MDIVENLLESLYNDVDAIYESGIIDFDEDYDRITIDIRDMDKSATMSRTFDAWETSEMSSRQWKTYFRCGERTNAFV